MDRPKAETLFREAIALQTEFWRKLTELEAEIGCDVDSNQDLAETTLDRLIDEGDPDTPVRNASRPADYFGRYLADRKDDTI